MVSSLSLLGQALTICPFFFFSSSHAASVPQLSARQAVVPVVQGTPEVLGLVTDPAFNRDSCNSVQFRDRTLWTCRDTQYLNEIGDPLDWSISSTAGWTQIRPNGRPDINPLPDGSGDGLLMTGVNSNESCYFPLQDGQCNDNLAGACGDDTRYAIWPDSPPLVASGGGLLDVGSITAYTWIINYRIRPDFSTVIADPSVSLFRITYDPSDDESTLPAVELVDGTFWPEGAFPYGAYGHVAHDGVAYLYGEASNSAVALARVPLDSIEDQAAYEFWDGSDWADTPPSIDDASANVPNVTAGGQGTYYYSDEWQSFVWIGQAAISVAAEFLVTTAPEPTGPWEEPFVFYVGENGSADLSAYSLQAHPDMVPPGENEIYLTYTKTDRRNTTEFDIYSTPLIRVLWG